MLILNISPIRDFIVIVKVPENAIFWMIIMLVAISLTFHPILILTDLIILFSKVLQSSIIQFFEGFLSRFGMA